ncbi:hypothetical protein P7D22_11195 [Lichenihabitans sp. Uapishka_5]|nr:hypothetical protein [Lichenihabitans sp. Uapishka_5]MDX7951733.1 hypothetical protein [Lichenihabitans sp. Uapishka_5]
MGFASALPYLRGDRLNVGPHFDVDKTDKPLIAIQDRHIGCADFLAQQVDRLVAERNHIGDIRRSHQNICEGCRKADRLRLVEGQLDAAQDRIAPGARKCPHLSLARLSRRDRKNCDKEAEATDDACRQLDRTPRQLAALFYSQASAPARGGGLMRG